MAEVLQKLASEVEEINLVRAEGYIHSSLFLESSDQGVCCTSA